MKIDPFLTAMHFARTRWGRLPQDRAALEALQARHLAHYLREVLPRAPLYREQRVDTLAELPLMDKADMMREFDLRNTRGIRLARALEVGLQAEASRDFAPALGDVTVGLSSGTSGNRGVFLVSRAERLRWAGIMLARALPSSLLQQLLSPWQPRLRIAFFLRANSNLYTTLNSRRIDFAFHDVLAGVGPALPRLRNAPPDILVGPPSVLHALAMQALAGNLPVAPRHILSVAEVLEERDRELLQAAFGIPPHQIYQATEGFLGYTCAHSTLHLNERFLHIEPDWLDAAHSRFTPIVTDFTRETQLIVRYRLNDVLRVAADAPCPCGSPERAIAAIEGRADEVLWLPAHEGRHAVAVFPDLIRRAMFLAGPEIEEFEVTQDGHHLRVGLRYRGDGEAARARVGHQLQQIWLRLGIAAPTLHFNSWQPAPAGTKRRRVRLLKGVEGIPCTY
jgi:putative adenylate-forming enzyme